jgi:hypothetical protein
LPHPPTLGLPVLRDGFRVDSGDNREQIRGEYEVGNTEQITVPFMRCRWPRESRLLAAFLWLVFMPPVPVEEEQPEHVVQLRGEDDAGSEPDDDAKGSGHRSRHHQQMNRPSATPAASSIRAVTVYTSSSPQVSSRPPPDLLDAEPDHHAERRSLIAASTPPIHTAHPP